MTNTPESPRWLTRQEAAEYADVSVETIKRWLRGRILTRHVNGLGQVRVDRLEMERKLTFVPEPETPVRRASA